MLRPFNNSVNPISQNPNNSSKVTAGVSINVNQNSNGVVSSPPLAQANVSVSVPNTSVTSVSHLNSNPIAGSNKAYYARN